MKRADDPRHKRRQKILKLLFTQSFYKKTPPAAIEKIMKNLDRVDKTIEKIAPEYPVKRINKVDLAILRLAVYELEVEKKEPPKVVVDEAIELAKEFAGDTSPAFINGALGKLFKTI